jgi:hypothetical protein
MELDEMQIKFSKNIELSDWENPGYDPMEIIWCKWLKENLIVSVRERQRDCCYVNFYSQLRYLHNYFPKEIDGDLEFTKRYVDEFLIKMSKLISFQ